MAWTAPCFYPFADVRWTTPKLDAPIFTGRKKPDGFAIHEPDFLQVQRDDVGVAQCFDELLQLWHAAFLDSTAKSQDRKSRVFRSSNLQQLGDVKGSRMATCK